MKIQTLYLELFCRMKLSVYPVQIKKNKQKTVTVILAIIIQLYWFLYNHKMPEWANILMPVTNKYNNGSIKIIVYFCHFILKLFYIHSKCLNLKKGLWNWSISTLTLNKENGIYRVPIDCPVCGPLLPREGSSFLTRSAHCFTALALAL